jgi:hypothetical protein
LPWLWKLAPSWKKGNANMSLVVELGELRIWRDDDDGKWWVARRVYVHGVAVIREELCSECADAVAHQADNVPLQAQPGYEDRSCFISVRESFDSKVEANSDKTAKKFETSAQNIERILKHRLHLLP